MTERKMFAVPSLVDIVKKYRVYSKLN